MKVLIIGSGGREHAIAYSLSKSSKVSEIHAIPGNPGIAKLGTCHPGNVEDLQSILDFVNKNDIDLTTVGNGSINIDSTITAGNDIKLHSANSLTINEKLTAGNDVDLETLNGDILVNNEINATNKIDINSSGSIKQNNNGLLVSKDIYLSFTFTLDLYNS